MWSYPVALGRHQNSLRPMTLSLDQTVTITSETLASELGGELVLLNLASGVYFGLDETGTRMWSVMTGGGTIQEALNVLLSEYDVDPELLKRDLTSLIERLAAKGLVQVSS